MLSHTFQGEATRHLLGATVAAEKAAAILPSMNEVGLYFVPKTMTVVI